MSRFSPRAVIFDLGSTLIEYESIPWPDLIRAGISSGREYLVQQNLTIPNGPDFQDIFSEIMVAFRSEAIASLKEWNIESAARLLFERLDIRHDGELPARFFDAFYEPVKRGLYVYDDTIETLSALKKSYETIGLISNTIFPERAHLDELARFKIAPFLDFTIFSSTFGLRKPHPDIFLEAARQTGCEPSECVYIGDRYVEDCQGPLSIGMTPILKRHQKREYPADMPDSLRSILSLSQLADHFRI